MAETFITFNVDDTSPTISYSPFSDTFGKPDLSAGWNPYFTLSGFATSQGIVGQGTSQHITSLDGASLGFQWNGTGITLLGNATQATYNISIDGKTVPLNTSSSQDNILLDMKGLPEGLHNITLTAIIAPGQASAPNTSSMVVFDQAIVVSSPTMPNPNDNAFNKSTLSDADIAFSGLWSIEPASDPGDTPQFHTSRTPGDKAFTMFNGSTLLILGRTSPGAGNYTVILDGASTMAVNQTFSARSSFTQNDSLLFFASDLDPTVLHSIQVVNDNNTELSLAVGGFKAFVPYIMPPKNDTQPAPIADLGTKQAFEKGTIAAFALAGILAFLLISGALFFFLVYRPRRRRRQQSKYARSGTRASAKPTAGDNDREYSEKGYQTNHPPVLNIAPMYDVKEEPDLEADSTNKDPPVQEGPSNRFSAISEGFQRWTRAAVRGSLGGGTLGGLRFRHSESPPGHISQDTTPGTEDGSPAGSGRNRPMSEISSWTETSSAARRRHEKRMGKMRAVVTRSWLPSPSYSGGGGSSEGHAYRNSRRESRRQSRRASHIPSAPTAEVAAAAVAGAAAESAFEGSGVASGRRRTLPVPNLSMPTRRPLEGTVEGHEPPSYAASVANSHSTPSTRTTNPRSADPSLIIPQSISTAPADAANEHDIVAESATISDMANIGHSPRTSVVRPRENLAAVLAGPRPSAPTRISTAADRKDMRDVLRSLRPRTSSTPTRQLPAPPSKSEPELSSRWLPSLTQPLAMSTLAEEQSPDSATSPTRRPLLPALATESENISTRSDPTRIVKKLPQTPTSPISSQSSLMPSPIGSGDDPAANSFLSLPQTSPFRVDFPASRNPSLRPLPSLHGTPERIGAALSAGDSSNPDIYFTPSVASSVAQNSSAQAVEDLQEGSSKRPFRFTALTLPTSSAVPTISSPQALFGPDDSPQSNSPDSFLDFTNSREGSLHQRPQSNKHLSRSLPMPPVIIEPQSRWSNTTVPTVTTSYGGGTSSYHGNVSSGESQYLGIPTGDDEFRHFSTSSTFPIPVQISIPPSPHHIMEHTPSPAGDSSQNSGSLQLQSVRVSATTQGSGELHVHPVMPIDNIDSPTEAAVSDSDIQFRHSFATDSDPHIQSAAPPSTSNDDEFRSRPYDPSILVGRVLGLPSPTSSTTARPPASHGRTLSASTPSLSIPRSMLASRSDLNSSNDRLNPGPSS